METECYKLLKEQNHSSRQTTILKIKFVSLNRNFTLHMFADETIGKVKEYLRNVLQKYNISNFELRTSFPNRVYNNDDETLKDANLIPNAIMFVR